MTWRWSHNAGVNTWGKEKWKRKQKLNATSGLVETQVYAVQINLDCTQGMSFPAMETLETTSGHVVFSDDPTWIWVLNIQAGRNQTMVWTFWSHLIQFLDVEKHNKRVGLSSQCRLKIGKDWITLKTVLCRKKNCFAPAVQRLEQREYWNTLQEPMIQETNSNYYE
jgi:hypothetical protein